VVAEAVPQIRADLISQRHRESRTTHYFDLGAADLFV